MMGNLGLIALGSFLIVLGGVWQAWRWLGWKAIATIALWLYARTERRRTAEIARGLDILDRCAPAPSGQTPFDEEDRELAALWAAETKRLQERRKYVGRRP